MRRTPGHEKTSNKMSERSLRDLFHLLKQVLPDSQEILTIPPHVCQGRAKANARTQLQSDTRCGGRKCAWGVLLPFILGKEYTRHRDTSHLRHALIALISRRSLSMLSKWDVSLFNIIPERKRTHNEGQCCNPYSNTEMVTSLIFIF